MRLALGDGRRPFDSTCHVGPVEGQPPGRILRTDPPLDDLEDFAMRATRSPRNGVTLFELGGWRVQLSAVHGNQAVAHELASLVSRIREAEPVDDVIDPRFEKTDKIFARDTGASNRLFVVPPELLLEHTVGCTCSLFLPQLEAAVTDLPSA